MAELPKDEPLVSSAFLLVLLPRKLLTSFGKEVDTMTTNLTICLIGMMAIVLIFTGSVTGEKMWPSEFGEQIVQGKESVEFESDPCDYNVDYGALYHPAERERVEEGIVKFECDPCDYNVDYGALYYPAEK
jgi:hypothetical protein